MTKAAIPWSRPYTGLHRLQGLREADVRPAHASKLRERLKNPFGVRTCDSRRIRLVDLCRMQQVEYARGREYACDGKALVIGAEPAASWTAMQAWSPPEMNGNA